MSSSAFPQLPIAWLPEPRDHDEDLPEGLDETAPERDATDALENDVAAGAPDSSTSDVAQADDGLPTSADDTTTAADDPPPTSAGDEAPPTATGELKPLEVDKVPLLPFAKAVETYVGWGTRACALAIDLLVLVLPFAAGVLVDSALMAYGVPMLLGQMTVIPTVLAAIVWNRGVWQGRTGQSLGKKAMSIRLADQSTDLPVGVRTALLRELAHVVDTLSVVGWLNPLWNGKRRTFADQIVGTVVLG
ncbi:MAG: RDD family protein [Cellulomonas sp.]